jgi:hypothetical protein
MKLLNAIGFWVVEVLLWLNIEGLVLLAFLIGLWAYCTKRGYF